MSLIIKGMDMPKSCYDCDLFSGEGFLCPLVIETTNDWSREFMYKRVDECPLVEIPTPHGRLIDADANVGSYVETWTCTCSEFGTQRVMAVDDLKNLPVIIEAEENDEK